MSEHYTDGRRWSHISRAWILEASWNDKEEIAFQRQRIAELEAEVERLNKVMDPIDQECCRLQAHWKAEAQWAAEKVLDAAGWIENREITPADQDRAKRICDGV